MSVNNIPAMMVAIGMSTVILAFVWVLGDLAWTGFSDAIKYWRKRDREIAVRSAAAAAVVLGFLIGALGLVVMLFVQALGGVQ